MQTLTEGVARGNGAGFECGVQILSSRAESLALRSAKSRVDR